MNNVVEMQRPHPSNSVLSDDQVAPVKMIYCKVSTLPKLFNISKATAYRFLKEADTLDEFKDRICVDVSATMTLVHIETFEEFLKFKHKKHY
ncbi:helix-turn-helix domain-containing protein [Macrococcus lamae]|uniref:Helix-turn-helix domain-containing protein n=1 Tax=Macrococcus lamae TaxID=198484 RepID=A0A4R6BTR3_9STAP|nr:helix-turn-helix domain-containing protein [Macrococcus lamae]TDM10451.1 helix-turn-helix domain-containing protein [Macrococcus lamae]